MPPRSRPTPAAPLRVAIDTTPLIGRRTGIGHLVAGLVAELENRAAVDVCRVAFTWRGRRAANAQRMPLPARPAHAVWSRSDLAPIEWWSGPVDVVHGTNYVVPPSRSAQRIVSVHDLTAVRFPELCTPATLRQPAMVRRAVRSGAWVHCDSQFVADEVADWLHLDPDRIRVVAPGIDTSVSAHTDVPAFAAGGAGSPPSPYILAVGTAEPRKDLPSLVRAFARLAVCHRDLRLVHVGPPGWGTEALDRAVAALAGDVGRRVERRGWVDDAERDNLLAGATVFAYPSLYEGFGLPPLEAMACGTPVVATRVGSLPEVLGDACTLVEPGDEEALAEAIHGLLEHDDQRAQAVALGRAQAARYTWSAAGDAMIDLYEDVVCAS